MMVERRDAGIGKRLQRGARHVVSRSARKPVQVGDREARQVEGREPIRTARAHRRRNRSQSVASRIGGFSVA